MLAALSKSLDEVRFRIPRPILEAVFTERDKAWRLQPTSVESHILNEAVRPRVLVDCNLVGGAEVFIPLDGVPVERTNDYTCVYKIPKTLTQGRSIISVLNITLSDPTKASSYGVAAGSQNTAMLQLGSAVMDAHGTIPVTSTARVQLIGENVVMVRDTIVLPANIFLRCIIANDENMSHLQLRSYRAFADLVVHAVKAYIYNEYIIRLDMGELYAGQQLGKFKEIVESYSEAEQNYQDFLSGTWSKVAFQNDQEQFTRHIRLLLGGSR